MSTINPEPEFEAKFIAKYILDKCIREQDPISNLQLQKILFFCQKEYYSKKGRALFRDDFEAWQYGPVVPVVYRQYSLWGGTKITWTSDGDADVPQSVKDIIDPIICEYRQYEPWRLVDMTHTPDSPWFLVYRDGAGDGCVIEKDLIASYSARLKDVRG